MSPQHLAALPLGRFQQQGQESSRAGYPGLEIRTLDSKPKSPKVPFVWQGGITEAGPYRVPEGSHLTSLSLLWEHSMGGMNEAQHFVPKFLLSFPLPAFCFPLSSFLPPFLQSRMPLSISVLWEPGPKHTKGTVSNQVPKDFSMQAERQTSSLTQTTSKQRGFSWPSSPADSHPLLEQ